MQVYTWKTGIYLDTLRTVYIHVHAVLYIGSVSGLCLECIRDIHCEAKITEFTLFFSSVCVEVPVPTLLKASWLK